VGGEILLLLEALINNIIVFQMIKTGLKTLVEPWPLGYIDLTRNCHYKNPNHKQTVNEIHRQPIKEKKKRKTLGILCLYKLATISKIEMP
jgi:hypothetical protein